MHFYKTTNSGVQPFHFVPMKSRPNELRPTRMSDVRKLWDAGEDVVPSVTTVLNTLDKAALTQWKINQHLMVAYHRSMSLDKCASLDEYLSEVKRLTELEMDKAPSAGTDVHKVLEDFMRDGIVAPGFEKICANVKAILTERCGDGPWQCEKRFVSPFGFGGCADLSRFDPAAGWVIDYKSKQTADKFKPGRMVYGNHSQQLASYRDGLQMPFARCANLFVCLETGEVDFHEHTEEQLNQGWDVFHHALAIWQTLNRYPAAQKEAA